MKPRKSISDLHEKWMKSPSYAAAYEALRPEFEIASAVIEARIRANLTQEELANRMNTKQAVIARLESGRVKPSTRTLERIAEATGSRMKVSFIALPKSGKKPLKPRKAG